MIQPTRPPTYNVYALRTRQEEIIYIGYSSDLKARLDDHRCNQPWSAEIHRHDVVGTFSQQDEALDLERHLIERYAPRYNMHFNPERPPTSDWFNRAALTRLRIEAGHSKTSFGEMIGVGSTHVSRMESGQRGVTPRIFLKIQQALGCPRSALMNAPRSEGEAA